MQVQPTISPYPISDFLNWEATDQLVMTPKFQRRGVWKPLAQSYLIDTIVRNMPIPPIFVRLTVDAKARKTVREVVDGQQRLAAVFAYLKNQIPLMAIHHEGYPDKFFSDLPDDIQEGILTYKFSVATLNDVSDEVVLDIFARVNSFNVVLNAQEKRNAKYFGAFKQFVYSLSRENYAFFTLNKVTTDQQVARMLEVELVSILVHAMLFGIKETRADDINELYGEFDKQFEQAKRIRSEFNNVLEIIGSIFQDDLKRSAFRRIPLFYTLFLAVYDLRYGLPDSPLDEARGALDPTRFSAYRGGAGLLSAVLAQRPPAEVFATFANASRLATADVGKRRLRHRYVLHHVFMRPVPLENP